MPYPWWQIAQSIDNLNLERKGNMSFKPGQGRKQEIRQYKYGTQ